MRDNGGCSIRRSFFNEEVWCSRAFTVLKRLNLSINSLQISTFPRLSSKYRRDEANPPPPAPRPTESHISSLSAVLVMSCRRLNSSMSLEITPAALRPAQSTLVGSLGGGGVSKGHFDEMENYETKKKPQNQLWWVKLQNYETKNSKSTLSVEGWWPQ